MRRPHKLTLDDFVRLFGAVRAEVAAACADVMRGQDFSYRPLSEGERDRVLRTVAQRIDSGDFTVAGPAEKTRWGKGWNENLEAFKLSGYNPEFLVPKYYRPLGPVRLFGDYVMPQDPKFQLHYATVFLTWLFQKYLRDIPAVYEFGCGTGLNLVTLAKLYPQKELHGLDWVEASREILELLREHRGYKMHGYLFDMFKPDYSVSLPQRSAVFTMGSLELLHDQFSPFLEYVRAQKPSIVVDVNSMIEEYDKENLFDYLAYKYEKVRKYLDGYFARLRSLAAAGKIEIIKYQRVHFGSLYHDGYSFAVWRPR